MNEIVVSAPGRICLFGEHQDYLDLPVIAAAINLRVTISGQVRDDALVTLNLPDIGEVVRFRLPGKGAVLPYTQERDYFKSVANVLTKAGLELTHGCEATVRSDIPIKAGTSSSSALNVAWARFLLLVNGVEERQFTDAEHLAHLVYLAEVEEFGESGGKMDQYASAVGGVLFMDFVEPVQLQRIGHSLGTFVLGDSREPKDTQNVLRRVRQGVQSACDKIKQEVVDFDLMLVKEGELPTYRGLLSDSEFEVLHGAILNRDLTRVALELLTRNSVEPRHFGDLLIQHHEVLDQMLQISTPKINAMLKSALDAGAYGGKINGSGGGGCMFVYAPEDPERVARAVEIVGGKPDVVQVDEGVQIEGSFTPIRPLKD